MASPVSSSDTSSSVKYLIILSKLFSKNSPNVKILSSLCINSISLSFPENEFDHGSFNEDICEFDHSSGRYILGDIVISVPKCEQQGKELGHSVYKEVEYLTVHSMLHLLGYDHMDEGEMKKQMRSREKIIMGEKE